jgi:hypothetical protein
MAESGLKPAVEPPPPGSERLWIEVYEVGLTRGLAEESSMDLAVAVTSSELWTSAYQVGREKGLSGELAMDFANAVTSSEKIQDWLRVYQIARKEDLSKAMARQYANSAVPAVEDEPVLANLSSRRRMESYFAEG